MIEQLLPFRLTASGCLARSSSQSLVLNHSKCIHLVAQSPFISLTRWVGRSVLERLWPGEWRRWKDPPGLPRPQHNFSRVLLVYRASSLLAGMRTSLS